MPESKEMTEQADWRAKQPSQVACVSEDLKCWEAWGITCGQNSKDTTLSIAWGRELAWKEKALNDLPWEDEKGPSSIRPTLELFQRQHWGNSWETGRSAYGLSLAHRYHLELNWTSNTRARARTHTHTHTHTPCTHTHTTHTSKLTDENICEKRAWFLRKTDLKELTEEAWRTETEVVPDSWGLVRERSLITWLRRRMVFWTLGCQKNGVAEECNDGGLRGRHTPWSDY